LDATRPSLKVYRMRHKVVTAYRCAQAMSKLIQENRSGRKVRGVLAHPGAKDLQPDRVDQRLGSGPVRVTPHSRSDHRTTSVLQWVDHCI
jgi:hypothetical protein